MSHEPGAGWIDRRVRAAMRSETGALRTAVAALAEAAQTDRAEIAETRAQVAELRGTIEALGAELRAHAERTDAGLNALREAIDGDERIEKLRFRLEGFSAQHRWDMDQLRQSLAAVAERLPIVAD
jgi:predicted RNase H-like nuclease (RuvC/YqgF family)